MNEQREADLIAGEMPVVTIYSDGGSRNNLDGTFGGYGAIAQWNGYHKFFYGGYPDATNNAMEIMGALSVIRTLTRPCRINIISDSRYLVDGVNSWVAGWVHNGWKTTTGKPVQNRELWNEMYMHMQTHIISATWARGHRAENRPNTLCDNFATIGMFQAANMPVPPHLLAPSRA